MNNRLLAAMQQQEVIKKSLFQIVHAVDFLLSDLETIMSYESLSDTDMHTANDLYETLAIIVDQLQVFMKKSPGH